MKAFLIQGSRMFFVIILECVFGFTMKKSEGVYLGFLFGDIIAGILGCINFV